MVTSEGCWGGKLFLFPLREFSSGDLQIKLASDRLTGEKRGISFINVYDAREFTERGETQRTG